MEGEHGKIDKICPSFVTTFKPRKRSPGLTQMISMKKNICTFVLFVFFFLFFFFCHLILTLRYSSRHDHETPDVNYLLSSIIICGRHHFFHLFNLSKTRYTLLPGIKIINKLLCCNQATLLIW